MRFAFALAACLASSAALAQPAGSPPAGAEDATPPAGADQLVGLFGATCLHFAGDTAALRTFLQQQNAPQMPAQARDAFLAGRQGQVFDVSYKTVKLALVSLDDGTCEAVVDQADPAQVRTIFQQAAAENRLAIQPVGTQPPNGSRPGVEQTAYASTLNGRAMHILVSTAQTPPQAVMVLVPR